MTLTEQETAFFLVGLLTDHEPFQHVRFGDGDVMFATGTGSKITGDGEEWTPELQERMRQAWHRICQIPNLCLGDLETYDQDDGVKTQWYQLLDSMWMLRQDAPAFVHMETLRAARAHAIPVYKAIAADTRFKALIAPERLAPAARMLGAAHIRVPLREAHAVSEQVAETIVKEGVEVALFCAGRGGKIAQGILGDQVTQIDIGSGLDILFTDLRRGTDHGIVPANCRDRFRAAGLDA